MSKHPKDCNRKEIKVHVCKVCSKVFVYKSFLDRHIKIHGKVKKSKEKKSSTEKINDCIQSQVFVGSNHSQSRACCYSSDIAEVEQNSAHNYDNNLADDRINLISTSHLFDIDLAQSDHINEMIPDDTR